MNEKSQYLLAVIPSQEIVNLLKEWKHLLKKEFGRYGSDNSLAHITVMGFEADLNQLPYWINKISSFCNNYTEYEIGFDGFNSFGSYVFYVKLDDGSVKYLNKLILDIHRYFGFKIKRVKSHMTIARELDEIRLESAYKLFKNHETDFKFLCDGFTLRKFNKSTGQYSDFIAEFKFCKQQLKLF